MGQKVKLVDTSLCQACKACQVACKQWNQLEWSDAGELMRGTYQNPPDMTFYTWNVVKFHEFEGENGEIRWIFRKDSCRHCPDPYCKMACPVEGVIVKDPETGAVYYNNDKCGNCQMECLSACPFNIPRFQKDEAGIPFRRAYKCRLCVDRLHGGNDPANVGRKEKLNKEIDSIPACAKVCPGKAIQFGDQLEMVERARKRVKELRNDHPGACIYPGEDYNVIWILTDSPAKFQLYAVNDREVRERIEAEKLARRSLPERAVETAGGALFAMINWRKRRLEETKRT